MWGRREKWGIELPIVKRRTLILPRFPSKPAWLSFEHYNDHCNFVAKLIIRGMRPK